MERFRSGIGLMTLGSQAWTYRLSEQAQFCISGPYPVAILFDFRAPWITDMHENDHSDLLRFLGKLGLATPGEKPRMEPLAGGVSSEIWRVDLASGPVCVKRALGRLKVAQVWEAPVERNTNEAEWMRVVGARVPGCCPKIIAEDQAAGLFVMEYLAPEHNRVWKTCLGAGEADAGFAARVGVTLARIHAATAGDEALARRFGDNEMFYALRLEPYLVATARAHPKVALRFEALVEQTSSVKLALVHGDVSPKNILVGPAGPMILDAECAWYGDPAFDLAFPLSHLLLKGVWKPEGSMALKASYIALVDAYLEGVDWEPRADVAKRAADLLPALLLARIDGKSPVEYLTSENDKNHVRDRAKILMILPSTGLKDIAGDWFEALAAPHH